MCNKITIICPTIYVLTMRLWNSVAILVVGCLLVEDVVSQIVAVGGVVVFFAFVSVR